MTICNTKYCDLDSFQENNKCVLHCKKNDYQSDKISGLLYSFYDELFDYILKGYFRYKEEDVLSNKNTLKNYLINDTTTNELKILQEPTRSFKEISIGFKKILFPERDSRDYFDYLKLLKKAHGIEFHYCEFKLDQINLSNVHCFFQDCKFHNNWIVYNTLTLDDNINNVLYQSCEFNKTVYSGSSEEINQKYEIESQLFNNCKFKNINFEKTIFTQSIFNNTDDNFLNSVEEQFKISDCEIKEKFILNDCTIGSILLENTVFESKLEFKNNIVTSLKIHNSNFLKLVDMYQTKFTSFHIEKSIFEDFVGFEKCGFGNKTAKDKNLVAKFTYATFLSFVNFRNTKFDSGLDIENINLKEPPNFLNIEINADYSNRETFRIIKNSFETIGNNIEANNFFSYEMKAYKDELKGSDKYQEKIVLFFNKNISNFGQSYVRPIVWMILTLGIYTFLISNYAYNLQSEILSSCINTMLTETTYFLNNMSKNILPFSRFLKSGMEFISLIFYIIFSILIWHTLVAIKRHTKK